MKKKKELNFLKIFFKKIDKKIFNKKNLWKIYYFNNKNYLE